MKTHAYTTRRDPSDYCRDCDYSSDNSSINILIDDRLYAISLNREISGIDVDALSKHTIKEFSFLQHNVKNYLLWVFCLNNLHLFGPCRVLDSLVKELTAAKAKIVISLIAVVGEE